MPEESPRRSWRLVADREFERTLRKLDRATTARIVRALQALCELDDPRVRCKPLQHSKAGLWRARIGDYRVIIAVEDAELVVIALDVGHRSTVYRD